LHGLRKAFQVPDGQLPHGNVFVAEKGEQIRARLLPFLGLA
jgi:hypothetical protein